MRLLHSFLFIAFITLTIYSSWSPNSQVLGDADAEDDGSMPRVDDPAKKGAKVGSATDDEVVGREEESIKLDGLNVAQLKELRASGEKHEFVAEVNRMMKLIINSLYKNKEIFLRELISNASDALDKIRFLSLTDKSVLGETEDLHIHIKVDKENRMMHITDTGIGMTRDDMVKYLGTIAKSQTSEFLNKFQEATASGQSKSSMSDLIGQFGVGFYSAFLVADKVLVTSKNNNDDQYVWESDSNSFSVSKDPRGNTLGRGTTVSLHLKEEAQEFLEETKLREIIHKYSQFITFNIYLWASKTVSEEVPIEDEAAPKKDTKKEEDKKDADADKDKEEEGEDATVEEDTKEADKPKTKKVDKTVWDWELMNSAKPIWQRKQSEVSTHEYLEFYKTFVKDDKDAPLTWTHFLAEGEVSFKSILYVPKKAPKDLFANYNTVSDPIKLYVRRVFISETFGDLLPKYLNFVRGVVDSDDLPLNVSRETLQQNKLLKVIKKKLVRKILDMIKKLRETGGEDFETFWNEYGTNLKLGAIEDTTNRVRLAKLLQFASSASSDEKAATTLEQYVSRMKDKQENIFYIAGTSRADLAASPFVERLLKKGYEVLFLVDPIDEYTMQSLPEFEGKRFQNVAKEGLNIDKSKQAEERLAELKKTYEPLINWIKDGPLKSSVESVKVSTRLVKTPMALVANQYGYSGNMERITRAQAYQKTGGDSMSQHYFTQKKILEINPGHPLIKELLKRVEHDPADPKAQSLVQLMFEAATLRSGFEVKDAAGFSERIEAMMRAALDISPDEKVDEEEEHEDEPAEKEADDEVSADNEGDDEADNENDNGGEFEQKTSSTKSSSSTSHDEESSKDHEEL